MESIINAIIEDDFDWFTEQINQKGADITDANGFTPLMYCVQNGREKMIDFLLKKGIDVNKVNNIGNTALFYAVFYSKNKTEIIEKLLKKGSDMNIANIKGITPLSLANTMANDKVKDLMSGWGKK